MGGTAARRHSFLRALAFFLGLGIGISTSGADLVLQRVPPLTVAQAPNYPQNLARFDLGAKIENINSVAFLSRQAKGTVAIALSNAKLSSDSPQWHDAGQEELSSGLIS